MATQRWRFVPATRWGQPLALAIPQNYNIRGEGSEPCDARFTMAGPETIETGYAPIKAWTDETPMAYEDIDAVMAVQTA